MSSPISCRSISNVNQTFNFVVVNLCLSLVRKVGLIAISLISFGNGNLQIYNRARELDDSWFDAVCNIYNEFSSRFVWSLRTRFDSLIDCIHAVRRAWKQYTTRCQNRSTYYVPNAHRNICNKPLNMHWVKVSPISFLIISRKFWCQLNKGTYCVNLNSHKSTVCLLGTRTFNCIVLYSGVACVSFIYDKAVKIAIISQQLQ